MRMNFPNRAKDEDLWTSVGGFTSVNKHERLPQAHAQQGVLHHQPSESSRHVPIRPGQVVNNAAVPGGEQRMGASVSLPADTPWLWTFPVQRESDKTLQTGSAATLVLFKLPQVCKHVFYLALGPRSSCRKYGLTAHSTAAWAHPSSFPESPE